MNPYVVFIVTFIGTLVGCFFVLYCAFRNFGRQG